MYFTTGEARVTMSTPEILKADLFTKSPAWNRNAIIKNKQKIDPDNLPLNTRTGASQTDKLGRLFFSKPLAPFRVQPNLKKDILVSVPLPPTELTIEDVDVEREEYIKRSLSHVDRANKTLGLNLSGSVANWRSEYSRQYPPPSSVPIQRAVDLAQISGSHQELTTAFAMGYGRRNRAHKCYMLTCSKSGEEDALPQRFGSSIPKDASPQETGYAAGEMRVALTKSRTIDASALMQWPQRELAHLQYPSLR